MSPLFADDSEHRTLVVVDFNNFIQLPKASPESVFTSRLCEVFNRTIGIARQTTYMSIRLYGGWVAQGTLTRHGSVVAQLIAAADLFPITTSVDATRRLVRGSVVPCTSSLALPQKEWHSLYRVSAGSPRLQLHDSFQEESCRASPERCPVNALKRFTQSNGKRCAVPGCEMSNSAVFQYCQQKKVDVLMAVDIVSACNAGYSAVAVFTDDTDVYPAIANAAGADLSVALFKTNQRRLDDETAILRDLGVEVKVLS